MVTAPDRTAAVSVSAGTGIGVTVDVSSQRIDAVEVAVPYDHSSIEHWCARSTYAQALTLLGRPCGICGHSHAPSFVLAVEELLSVEVPPLARTFRAVWAALGRARAHLEWVEALSRALGLSPLGESSREDSDRVGLVLDRISGSRAGRAVDVPGGVHAGARPDRLGEAAAVLGSVMDRARRVLDLVRGHDLLTRRLSGLAALPGGDLRERATVHLRELIDCCSAARGCASAVPTGPLSVEVPDRVPGGAAVGRFATSAGDELHRVVADGSDVPERTALEPPAAAVPALLASALAGAHVADLCVVAASVDPRLVGPWCVVHVRDREKPHATVMSWDALAAYGVAWHAARGVDLSLVHAP
jgi:Ni,Fe-hydrogenase III large subunit